MFQITTQFQSLYLSAELPEKVEFSVDSTSFTLMVYHDHTTIFRTTLYPYNGNAVLHDLRSIIEDALRTDSGSRPTFSLYITNGSSYASSNEFNVVYSDIILNYSADLFCRNYFLTTRTSFRISSTGVQRLSLFAKAGETYDGYTECVVLPEGAATPVVLRLIDTVYRTSAWSDGVDYYDIEADLINDAVCDNYPDQAGKLLAFTVHRGNRTMTFYVTDEEPDVTFKFRNAFDCIEYAELYAVTMAKQKMERSEAVCQRNHIFYDQQTEQTFEVETACMTYEEAVWLNQLLASRKVIYANAVGGQNVEVLIIDSTSEVSDSDDAKNRIKFTWKYANDVQRHRILSKSMNFTMELST